MMRHLPEGWKVTDYSELNTDLFWRYTRFHTPEDNTISGIPGPEPTTRHPHASNRALVLFQALRPPAYCVSVYMHGRTYGGPEEGGWWYDTYQPETEFNKTCLRQFTNLPDALEYRDQLQKYLIAETNDLIACIDEDAMPHYQPIQRPHYE